MAIRPAPIRCRTGRDGRGPERGAGRASPAAKTERFDFSSQTAGSAEPGAGHAGKGGADRVPGIYRSVHEQHGSTEAWMSGMSASCCWTHMASMEGMFKKLGVRILTRDGVSLPSEAR